MIGQKVLLLSFLSCILGSQAAPPERLVGATNAAIGEFPYQVSIRLYGSHFCGGSLISKQHVLTAAHCIDAVKTMPLSSVTAVVGTNSVSTGGDVYKVKSLKQHPSYGSNKLADWMYDIGVITLASEVKLSSRVAIVKLPKGDVKPGDKAVVSGWGTTKSPTTPLSQSLQKLTLDIISFETCQNQMPYFAKVHDSHICTYVKKGVGSCSGDSGGPLVAEGEVVGVVSGGIPCAIGYPDVFTNVYKYLDFIEPIVN